MSVCRALMSFSIRFSVQPNPLCLLAILSEHILLHLLLTSPKFGEISKPCSKNRSSRLGTSILYVPAVYGGNVVMSVSLPVSSCLRDSLFNDEMGFTKLLPSQCSPVSFFSFSMPVSFFKSSSYDPKM